MNRNDGGPAFPESYEGADAPHEGIGGGMTLRDYAIIHFQAAFIAADHFVYSPEDAARWAEAHADAMLARRVA